MRNTVEAIVRDIADWPERPTTDELRAMIACHLDGWVLVDRDIVEGTLHQVEKHIGVNSMTAKLLREALAS